MQYNSVSPDFRHKTKNQCLWIDDGHNNPSWIHEKRAFLLSLQEENQVRNKNCKKEFDLVALLKDCTKKKDLYGGIKIYTYTHEIVLLRKSPHIASCLIHMFTKCGDFVMAKEVLANFSFSNVVPWNTLISGYVHNGQAQEALECYERMQNKGVSSNAVTFTCILKACASANATKEGQEIHVEIEKKGLLETNPSLGNTLVCMYADCGLLIEAQEIFNHLPIVDAVSWTALMGGYTRCGYGEKALNCFNQIQNEGLFLDAIAYVCCLNACAILEALDRGREIHAKISCNGFIITHLEVGNTLIGMYAKCGMLTEAQKVFNDLPVQDTISWNAMIAGYAKHERGEEAFNLFEQMQQKGIPFDVVTLVCGVKTCGRLGASQKGEKLHDEISRRGLLEKDLLVGNALIEMYAECGLLPKAHQVFEEIPLRDVVSWTLLITGYAQQGQGEEALNCYDKMQKEGFSPDPITFSCILKACAGIGDIEKGKEIHDEIMKHNLLEKNVVIATALVDMYAKCGMLGKAQQVFDKLQVRDVVSWTTLMAGYVEVGKSENVFHAFEQMLGEGVKPNLITFVVVLNACSRQGLLNKSETYFQSMTKDYGITPTIEHHSCIVDLLSRVGELEEAEAMIKKMPIIPNFIIWHTLLGASKHWGTLDFGKQAFQNARVFA